MRVIGPNTCSADPPSNMTAVAGLGAMTRQTAPGFARYFHRVASDEVGGVREVFFDAGGLPHLHLEALSYVMAVVTTFLAVAILTLLYGIIGCLTMTSIPPWAMAEISAREKIFQVALIVTGNAHAVVPLFLMGVALKTATHGREWRGCFF